VRIVLLDPPNFTPPYDDHLAAALAARAHEVDLLASPPVRGRAPEPHGYRRHEPFLPLSSRLVQRAPRSPARHVLKGAEYPFSVRRALGLLGRLRPDVVHVQWLGLPRYDVRWLRRIVERYPTVLTAHDVFPRRRASGRAWGEALGLVDRVVVHSDRAVAELAAAGLARERLVRVLHPVFPAPTGRSPGEPSGTTLLFFGLVRAYKGLDVLVRALPAVLAAAPEARLVVAGEPFDPPDEAVRLARELSVEHAIEWRLRFMEDEEAADLFARAAVAVLPYRKLESSGVLATALGYGRPAVVSDVGSLGPIVGEFAAGRVIPPDDSGALARACVELLTDEEALRTAAQGARAAAASLTWARAAEEHEAVYREIAAARMGT
jgi:glycosyltransferase involved in cell wall biosynthesis